MPSLCVPSLFDLPPRQLSHERLQPYHAKTPLAHRIPFIVILSTMPPPLASRLVDDKALCSVPKQLWYRCLAQTVQALDPKTGTFKIPGCAIIKVLTLLDTMYLFVLR